MSKKDTSGRSEHMAAPFYHNVPSWMIRYLAHAKCSKCGNSIRKANLTAIGIRGQDGKSVPYVEYQCPKCDHRAMKSFGGQHKGTVEEICYMLLEEVQNKRRIRSAQYNESRGQRSETITDDEVNRFLDSMRKCKTYVDLLDEIGATEWLEPDKEKDES